MTPLEEFIKAQKKLAKARDRQDNMRPIDDPYKVALYIQKCEREANDAAALCREALRVVSD